MYYYKNAARVTKTYYGQVFKPGEVKPVPGYINDSSFVRVPTPVAGVESSSKSKISGVKAASGNAVDNSKSSAAKKQEPKKPAQEVKKGDKVDG